MTTGIVASEHALAQPTQPSSKNIGIPGMTRKKRLPRQQAYHAHLRLSMDFPSATWTLTESPCLQSFNPWLTSVSVKVHLEIFSCSMWVMHGHAKWKYLSDHAAMAGVLPQLSIEIHRSARGFVTVITDLKGEDLRAGRRRELPPTALHSWTKT